MFEKLDQHIRKQLLDDVLHLIRFVQTAPGALEEGIESAGGGGGGGQGKFQCWDLEVVLVSGHIPPESQGLAAPVPYDLILCNAD